MALALRKAERKQAKLKIGLFGPSGSGKTYSALLLASGIAPWEKIAVIDTENNSADLYSHLGGYNVLPIAPPFTPEKYVEAIHTCEQAGMDVIIIDSMSHEWEGTGGCLEIHGAMLGNSYTNWGQVTPRHNKFIETILQSGCHIICCTRVKQDYVLTENNKGKQVPQKVGLKGVTREGFDYEMTICFDLDIKHNASTSKDRTSLFMDKPQFMVNADTGKALLDWADSGAVNPEPLSLDYKRAMGSILRFIQEHNISPEEVASSTGVVSLKEVKDPMILEAMLNDLKRHYESKSKQLAQQSLNLNTHQDEAVF